MSLMFFHQGKISRAKKFFEKIYHVFLCGDPFSLQNFNTISMSTFCDKPDVESCFMVQKHIAIKPRF